MKEEFKKENPEALDLDMSTENMRSISTGLRLLAIGNFQARNRKRLVLVIY